VKLKISEGKRNKKKRSKGRPKKFEGESKVISFRVDKEIYEKKKDVIRERINHVIEREVKNKDKTNKVETFERKDKINERDFKQEIIKPKYNNNARKIEEEDKEQEENKIDDKDEDLINYYEKKRNEVKSKVSKFIEENPVKEEIIPKKRDLSEIYNEFKDFIDVDNTQFKQFIDKDKNKVEKDNCFKIYVRKRNEGKLHCLCNT